MVFDPKEHVIGAGGFAHHKDTGHRIGIDQAPTPGATEHEEFPKWVAVHDSHVVRGEHGHVSVPGFDMWDVERGTGNVKVIAYDEEDEQRATSQKQEQTETPPQD